MRLKYSSDGSLIANAFVDRSDDANESQYTNLFSYTFNTLIAIDTYYILSIRFVGKKLIFGCVGDVAEYTINTPIYPAYGEHRTLRSRVYHDPGESGYIKVRFDDVYIAKKRKWALAVPLLLLDE